jgi:outer membrane immunogenic protein
MKMTFLHFRRISIGTLLILSTTSLTFAANEHSANYKGEMQQPLPIPALRDQFYVGLQGGYDAYGINVTDNIGGDTSKVTANPLGWVGGIFAGYGKYFNRFYLGAEAFYNDSSADYKNTINDTDDGIFSETTYKVDSNYGIAIIPGYKFTDATLCYARLAYNVSHIKVSSFLTGTAANDYNGNASKTLGGFMYGVGVETLIPQLSDHVSVRAEYTYTDFSSFSTSSVKFSQSDNQFLVGIVYHI